MPKNSFLIEVYLESIGLGVFFDSIFPFHADCLEILLIISSHYFLYWGLIGKEVIMNMKIFDI